MSFSQVMIGIIIFALAIINSPKNETVPFAGINNELYQMCYSSEISKEEWSLGYVGNSCKIYSQPDETSQVLSNFNYNDEICYTDVNDDWVQITYNDTIAYISSNEINEQKYNSTKYDIPNYDGFKSYMPYTAITNKESNQYKLQQQSYTAYPSGIRMYDNRYCIAIGSHFNVNIGDYVDVILENGETIHCIVADQKADKDTDSNNIFTSNGCCTEFIIDSNALNKDAKYNGDISYSFEEWNSKVIEIVVYEKNALE